MHQNLSMSSLCLIKLLNFHYQSTICLHLYKGRDRHISISLSQLLGKYHRFINPYSPDYLQAFVFIKTVHRMCRSSKWGFSTMCSVYSDVLAIQCSTSANRIDVKSELWGEVVVFGQEDSFTNCRDIRQDWADADQKLSLDSVMCHASF